MWAISGLLFLGAIAVLPPVTKRLPKLRTPTKRTLPDQSRHSLETTEHVDVQFTHSPHGKAIANRGIIQLAYYNQKEVALRAYLHVQIGNNSDPFSVQGFQQSSDS